MFGENRNGASLICIWASSLLEVAHISNIKSTTIFVEATNPSHVVGVVGKTSATKTVRHEPKAGNIVGDRNSVQVFPLGSQRATAPRKVVAKIVVFFGGQSFSAIRGKVTPRFCLQPLAVASVKIDVFSVPDIELALRAKIK